MTKPYRYKLRPGYGSSQLLIEFIIIKEPDNFIKVLLEILTARGFLFNGTTDVWMNDEIWIHLQSSNGKIIVTKDVHGFVFILGENNQMDILRIGTILLKSGLFEKEETDYSKYKR